MSGRGAMSAAISGLMVSRRRSGAFSHSQPPCMKAETMHTGAATFTRSSTAMRMKVCVPPPEAPVQASLSGSTSGRLARKSRPRIAFQSWSFIRLRPHSSFCSLAKEWPIWRLESP